MRVDKVSLSIVGFALLAACSDLPEIEDATDAGTAGMEMGGSGGSGGASMGGSSAGGSAGMTGGTSIATSCSAPTDGLSPSGFLIPSRARRA